MMEGATVGTLRAQLEEWDALAAIYSADKGLSNEEKKKNKPILDARITE